MMARSAQVQLALARPFVVAVFSEGDFEKVFGFHEADAFCEGVSFGGDLYGGGSLHAYVLPSDEIEEFENEQAVAAFRRAIEPEPEGAA